MDFDTYQKLTKRTVVYNKGEFMKNLGKDYIYLTLGLSGEAGEVAGKIKKVLRDKNGIINNETKEELTKELGDVLWYLARLSAEIKVPLNEIAEKNIEKLESRKKRKALHGDGDNR